MARYPGSLTDVTGIRVGHAQDEHSLTGCSAILCPAEGAVAGGVVRGYAPGTRETALLQPGMLVGRVHAILLTGGSAFGLAAADGVMRYLEEHGVGYDTGVARVPIVPAAVLFDLNVGDALVRPTAAMGYEAAQAASAHAVLQGNVGAGTGATVGKFAGPHWAMKGGLGMASLQQEGVVVAALIAVNALGNISDPETGQVLAGARGPDGAGWARVLASVDGGPKASPGNTVIGVLATNASLDGPAATRLAHAGHDGLARAIQPAHTLYDGDTLFALSVGSATANPVMIDALATAAVERAVANAVLEAQAVAGFPAARDYQHNDG
ncbi:MAG: P1 family peptidase [Anaerolineae bacterium]|jgi:L-aminopeptidase/D-esterase-like protein|nr:P1 family peptidase [Chloroflexota bacterium]